MAADERLGSVLSAIALLDDQYGGGTVQEIGAVVTMSASDVDLALSRALVGGWASRQFVAARTGRNGVRTGAIQYRLTDMGVHRSD